MHFATSQTAQNNQYFVNGVGSRPTTASQQQTLQQTGEFILPDVSAAEVVPF